MRLRDKVAVITGAGSGLGRASAFLFAEHGAKLVIVDIVPSRCEAVARDLIELGFDAVAQPADMTVEMEAQDAVKAAIDRFGKLDVLYNNAGIDLDFGTVPIEHTDLDRWRRVVDVNLTAVFLATKHAIPHMRQNGGGSIVVTSSVGGQIALRYWPAYCASKAAADMYVKALALEVGQWNIRVNAVAPMDGMSPNFWLPSEAKVQDKTTTELMAEDAGGWNPSDWPFPLKGPEPPSFLDNAYAALYLASDEARWTSGTILATTHAGMLHMSATQANPEPGSDRTANDEPVVDAVRALAARRGIL